MIGKKLLHYEILEKLPLMQGVMAAVALGGGGDYFTGELMAIGIVLNGGSYLLGKVLARRKLRSIRERNEVLKIENARAAEHNKEIELQIRRVHAENVRQWEATAKSRGVVEAIPTTRKLLELSGGTRMRGVHCVLDSLASYCAPRNIW